MDGVPGLRAVQSDRMVVVGRPHEEMWGYAIVEAAALSLSSSDFEQMTAELRRRLRPTPALTLADRLRVYLGLSSATDEPREDVPTHDEIAQPVSLGPSDLKRRLSAVLSAIRSYDSPQPREIHGAVIAANIAKLPELVRANGD
jgi:hypothetical protein